MTKDMGKVHESNELVEDQLTDRLAKIEQAWSADALMYRGPIYFGADDLIRDLIEQRAGGRRNKLAFIIETEGGYAEVAQRIAETLRRHYTEVDFIIPNYAMSAGTILVMSGDAIHMDYYSVLGPIDPQVKSPINNNWIPALGYLEEFNRLIRKASKGSLNTAEMAYLINKFDPAELCQYKHERELSIALVKEWLVKYKFKNWKVTRTSKKRVTQAMRVKRAGEIAEILNNTTKWHTHGRGISMVVLERELNLLIEDFGADEARNSAIRNYYKLLKNYMLKRSHKIVAHGAGAYVEAG